MEQLQATNRFLDILNQLADAISITDTNGIIKYINSAYTVINGYTKEEAIGASSDLLNSKLHTKEFFGDLWQTLKSGKPYNGIITNRRKDGSFYEAELVISPIKDANDAITHYLTVARDISSQLELNSQLKVTKNIIDHTSDALFLIDELGEILFANHAATLLLKKSMQEILGAHLNDFRKAKFSNEDIAVFVNVARDEGKVIFEDVLIVDAGFITTEVVVSLMHYRAKEVLCASVRNISERKRKEELLKIQALELNILNSNLEAEVNKELKKRIESEQMLVHQTRMAAMGEMLGAIAHQWRQPLNIVGLKVQSLSMYMEDGELDQKLLDKTVEETMQTILKMSQTIDQFHNFFKLENLSSDFVVQSELKSTIGLISEELAYRNIEVEYELDSEPIIKHGFTNEFKQVILNLLINAKEAIYECKARKNGKIIIRATKQSDKTQIEIEDSGVGISQKIVDRIFDPYFTTKLDSFGTGIGLYMSQVIISNSFKGRLYNRPKKDGAIFVIEF